MPMSPTDRDILSPEAGHAVGILGCDRLILRNPSRPDGGLIGIRGQGVLGLDGSAKKR